MKLHVAAAAIAAIAATSAAAAGPFDQFKGKMKEGMYEYKMDMDMGQIPGMPPGMGKQSHTFQRCVTAQDIEKGSMGRSGKDNKMPENCEVKDFNMSGNTASYKMVCKGDGSGRGMPPMTADNRITFVDNGYSMDVKMAMDQGGQAMNMSQHMEAKYLGACK
jgi:hypothetical protein